MGLDINRGRSEIEAQLKRDIIVSIWNDIKLVNEALIEGS